MQLKSKKKCFMLSNERFLNIRRFHEAEYYQFFLKLQLFEKIAIFYCFFSLFFCLDVQILVKITPSSKKIGTFFCSYCQ